VQHEAGSDKGQVPARPHGTPASFGCSLSWTKFAMSSKVVALISILTFAVNHVRGDCYTRDGTTMRRFHTFSHDSDSSPGTAAKASRYYNGPELVACGRNSQTCCLAGQKCGSNLLCSEGPKLTREYCANKNWENCSPLGAGE
jgi:hypothetical protein